MNHVIKNNDSANKSNKLKYFILESSKCIFNTINNNFYRITEFNFESFH